MAQTFRGGSFRLELWGPWNREVSEVVERGEQIQLSVLVGGTDDFAYRLQFYDRPLPRAGERGPFGGDPQWYLDDLRQSVVEDYQAQVTDDRPLETPGAYAHELRYDGIIGDLPRRCRTRFLLTDTQVVTLTVYYGPHGTKHVGPMLDSFQLDSGPIGVTGAPMVPTPDGPAEPILAFATLDPHEELKVQLSTRRHWPTTFKNIGIATGIGFFMLLVVFFTTSGWSGLLFLPIFYFVYRAWRSRTFPCPQCSAQVATASSSFTCPSCGVTTVA